MLRAVIFDFDGVIADSEPLHLKAFNLALERHGVVIGKEKYYSDYLGFSDKDCVRVINKDYNLGMGLSDYDDLIRRKGEFFDKLAISESSIIDGTAELIGMLRQNSIRMAICSGALIGEIKTMLSMSGFSDAFEFIVAADDVARGKPDPEGYLLALEKLNSTCDGEIKPHQCLAVEDSHWGLEAAGAAKMRRIGVTNTYPEELLEPFCEMTSNHLADLTIEQLQGLCS
ncbi:MAG: HAD family phosphatase [Planctomycetes bacterium]|nr:HAD family phosphatase [Planctomycetota bacterium]